LSQQQFQPTPACIPGEGWSIFLQGNKLATFNQTIFNQHTQYQYSRWYWQQPSKLGPLFETIDWKTCGITRRQCPLSQQLWTTKWVTNWLPTGKNMVRWQLWQFDHCPSCQTALEDTRHLLRCHDPDRVAYLSAQVRKLEGTLLSKNIPLPAVQLMLSVVFPQHYPPPVAPPESLVTSQSLLDDHRWGLPALPWHQHLEPFLPDPTKRNYTLRWMSTFLRQLWNTAWDLWRYRNGIVHHWQDKARSTCNAPIGYSVRIRKRTLLPSSSRSPLAEHAAPTIITPTCLLSTILASHGEDNTQT